MITLAEIAFRASNLEIQIRTTKQKADDAGLQSKYDLAT